MLLKNATVALPWGFESVDVLIENGKIAAIGQGLSHNDELDLTGKHLLPGVIDSQVHFREPGLEYKEDLESGTRGAALGGVTAICEMPNTKPATTTKEALQDKFDRAANNAHVNYAFFVGAAAENVENLPALETIDGVCGVKIFMGSSTGNLLVADDETLYQVLSHGRRRVAVHCEDEPRLIERQALAIDSAHNHPIWRDEESAIKATRRLLNAAEKANRPVHTLHITTAEEIELLAHYKHIATVEVTPQHLTLNAENCYDELGSKAQMNPPIRGQSHQDGLWRGIRNGVVDVIGSDHAPHTLEEKALPYPQSPSGMTGVQTLLPIMLNHVADKKLSLERLVDLVCASPARIYNMIGKGRIAVGYDADFTVVDLNKQVTIQDSWIASKCGWTPFHNKKVTGWPTHTIINGQIIMRNDQIIKPHQGKKLKFQ